MEATNINEQIINAIEATNATVDQLVQQGNELCDDVDNLRAADERLGEGVEAIRSSLAADKEHISANKEAIASQAKDLADIRAAVEGLGRDKAQETDLLDFITSVGIEIGKHNARIEAQDKEITDLRSGVAALAKEIADLRAIVQVMHATIGAQAKSIEANKDAIVEVAIEANKDAIVEVATPATTPVEPVAQTTDMAALIARIPKPDAVRTRAAQKDAPVVEAPAPVVEAPAPVVEAPAPAPRKDAAVPKPVVRVQNNAVETRAYARQYMIENGAKVEQLRDPAAIEATVASDAFAAWLATR